LHNISSGTEILITTAFLSDFMIPDVFTVCLFLPGVVPVSLVTATSSTASKPIAPSVTNMATQFSSLSAAQIYEMLEHRDAQLRKSE